MERCVILAEAPILTWEPEHEHTQHEPTNPLAVRFSEQEFVSLIELEQEYINHVLKCFKGRKTKAAKVLGIDKTTLWRKLRRYDNEEETV